MNTASRPPSRKIRSLRPIAVGFGLFLLAVAIITGGAILPASGDNAPTASPTPTPSVTATPTPTPTPTSDTAPADGDGVTEASGDPAAPQSQPEYGVRALALLETLPIKGRAPMTGYSRDEFGQGWVDVDRNGCDTRNDMLNRDLTQIRYANSVPCKVSSGMLADPYTGTNIPFLRGQTTSIKVQIDHIVALADAWQKGAQQLSFDQRVAFANDPLNLQSTDGPTNGQKGAGDAATWLPPNTSYRCTYVARQISVKATYRLWVTQAEHDAMARILSNCPDAMAPTNQQSPAPAPVQETPPPPAPVQEPAPAPAPVQEPAPAPAPAVYYANCSAVRAAGAAPIYAGQPGYGSHLDRDGDGVACE